MPRISLESKWRMENHSEWYTMPEGIELWLELTEKELLLSIERNSVAEIVSLTSLIAIDRATMDAIFQAVAGPDWKMIDVDFDVVELSELLDHPDWDYVLFTIEIEETSFSFTLTVDMANKLFNIHPYDLPINFLAEVEDLSKEEK